MFAFFDFEKQIFLVFMIIHAANSALCDQCQRFLLQSFVFFLLSSQLIFISHTNTLLYSLIFLLNHKTVLLPMLLCSVTNFGP